MKRYAVRVTALANKQIQELMEYLKENTESQELADHQFSKVITAIASLEYFPERGFRLKRRYDNSYVHRLIVSPYLIFYRILLSEVHVLSVLHQSSITQKYYH